MASHDLDWDETDPERQEVAISQARRVFREWTEELQKIRLMAERLKQMSRIGGTHE